jgi:hypothetical protein
MAGGSDNADAFGEGVDSDEIGDSGMTTGSGRVDNSS